MAPAPAAAQTPGARRAPVSAAETRSARLRAEGDAHLAAGRTDAAIGKYEEAHRAALADGGATHVDVARASLALARAHAAKNDLASARPHFDEALRVFDLQKGELRFLAAAALDAIAAIHMSRGAVAEAERALERALRIAEEAVGERDPRRSAPLGSLARLRVSQGRAAEALPLVRRAIELVRGAPAEDPKNLVPLLVQLVETLRAAGDGRGADRAADEALAGAEAAFGKDHVQTAWVLAMTGGHHAMRGDPQKAATHLTRALAIHDASGNAEHPVIVSVLGSLALAQEQLGRAAEARTSLERASRVIEKRFGRESPELARPLVQLARLEQARGRATEALGLLERARDLQQKAFGPEHPSLVDTLEALGSARIEAGQREDGLAILRRALAIGERAAGKRGKPYAFTLFVLGTHLEKLGDSDRAREVLEEAVTASDAAFGPDAQQTATALGMLASVLLRLEDYPRAERAMLRVVSIRDKTEGPRSVSTALALGSLADLLVLRGDVSGAKEAARRAGAAYEATAASGSVVAAHARLKLAQLHVALSELDEAARETETARGVLVERLGPDAADLAVVDRVLASVERARGRSFEAEKLLEKGLARVAKERSDHPDLVLFLTELATLAADRQDLTHAYRLLERAEAISVKTPGTRIHAHVGTTLAFVLHALGRNDDAAKVAARVVADLEAGIGAEHPDLARPLLLLGMLGLQAGSDRWRTHVTRARKLLSSSRGDEARELGFPSFLEALGLAVEGRGKEAEATLARVASMLRDDPGAATLVASSEAVRALLLAERGDLPASIAALRTSIDLAEGEVSRALGQGTDDERADMIEQLGVGPMVAVDVHLSRGAKHADAAKLAATAVLRTKGRALDATAASMGALRRRLDADDRKLLDELASARALAARLDVASPPPAARQQHAAALRDAWQGAFALERSLAERSRAFALASRPLTLDAVEARLPGHAALVELVLYTPIESRKLMKEPAAQRYAAYVIRRGAPPSGFDLGPAEVIDREVAAFRRAIAKEPLDAVHEAHARRLRELVLAPIEGALGAARHLYVAPDGQLNLVPFAALLDADGRPALERWGISYLSSVRDLLVDDRPSARTGPVIVANPAFGAKPPTASKTQPASSSPFARASFSPLPGTAEEASALRPMLPGARVLDGALATKAAVSALAGPRILHVATHGFFFGDERSIAKGRALELEEAAVVQGVVAPLVRSGLAFAGANQRDARGDGILTALEAASLDLLGTKLVVLSACETGVGEIRNGHGVYGLRRALVVAGAETQVMSLWKVDDESTRDLMTAYYDGLRRGVGRAEAMRQAQLRLAAESATAHPYHWAAFVVSGDASTLDGAAAPPPSIGPPARGCACEVPSSPKGDAPPAALAALAVSALVIGRRLRRLSRFGPCGDS